MRQPDGLRVLQNDSVQRTLVSAVAQVLITRAATMMWVVERLIADRDLGAYLPAGFRALLCATILGTLPTVASAMSKDAERELIGIWDAEIAAVSINIEQGDKAVLLDKQSTTFHYSVSNDDEITLVGDDPDKKIVFRYNDEQLVGTSKDGEVAIFRKRPAKLLEVVGRAIWKPKGEFLGTFVTGNRSYNLNITMDYVYADADGKVDEGHSVGIHLMETMMSPRTKCFAYIRNHEDLVADFEMMRHPRPDAPIVYLIRCGGP